MPKLEAVSHVPELSRLVRHPSEDAKGLRCPLPPRCFAPTARKRAVGSEIPTMRSGVVLRWSLFVTGIRWD